MDEVKFHVTITKYHVRFLSHSMLRHKPRRRCPGSGCGPDEAPSEPATFEAFSIPANRQLFKNVEWDTIYLLPATADAIGESRFQRLFCSSGGIF